MKFRFDIKLERIQNLITHTNKLTYIYIFRKIWRQVAFIKCQRCF